MNNFSGKASEIIEYYFTNFEKMDEQSKRNFSDLIGAILNSNDVLYLIDLYSDLDFVEQKIKRNIEVIGYEMDSRRFVLDYSDELENYANAHNCSRGEALVEISHEISDRKSQYENKTHIKEQIERFKKSVENSIFTKVSKLSSDEKENLTQKFNEKVTNVENSIQTLRHEINSRKSKAEELMLTAEQESAKKEISNSFNHEIYVREEKIKELSQYSNTYERYSTLMNNKKII